MNKRELTDCCHRYPAVVQLPTDPIWSIFLTICFFNLVLESLNVSPLGSVEQLMVPCTRSRKALSRNSCFTDKEEPFWGKWTLKQCLWVEEGNGVRSHHRPWLSQRCQTREGRSLELGPCSTIGWCTLGGGPAFLLTCPGSALWLHQSPDLSITS